MNPILRNILALIAGLVGGSILNMSLVQLGPQLIPLPPGADVSTPEGLKAAIPLFELKHFLFPFLAHALGTLCGAYLAARIAASHHLVLAMTIAAFFLAGGIAMIFMVPSPMWFAVADLVFAYVPMGWLGWKLTR